MTSMAYHNIPWYYGKHVDVLRGCKKNWNLNIEELEQ